MNIEIEERFVRLFCSKRVRDRLIHELSSKTKRKEALSRFAHGCEHVLIEDYMNEIEKPSSDSREILRLLKKYEASNEAYCLSFDPELDGRTVPLPDALQAAEALYKLKLGRTSNELSKLGRQLYVRRDRHDLSRKRRTSAAVG